MLCFETNKDTSTIRSSPIAFMYRNLPTDTSQPSTDGNFFQPPYNQRINQPHSYPPTTYGPSQTTFSSNEHVPPGPGLGHEYSSQFFVSDLNPHFHGEGASAHCSWGAGGFYGADNLHSGLNSWDHATQTLHGHMHSGAIGSPSISGFTGPSGPGQPPLVDSNDPSSLPSASLAGIDCFSNASEAGPSGPFPLSIIPHRTPPSQRRPFEWISKNAYQNPQTQQGKTRTKDKYRVVYSDHQRLELEKEFRFSRYITIRRKSELAEQLCLSERQVKIWFQNRRAKERKASKKTAVNSNSGEEQEGLEDGEASDNSLQGEESPSVLTSLSGSQTSPSSSQQQHPQQILLGFGTTSEIGSPLTHPQGGIASQSSQLQYPFPIESPRQPDDYGHIQADCDIKPTILPSNDNACNVTSSVNDISTIETAASSPSVQNELKRL